ncbi:stress protein [Streptomyces sp. NPDC004539]|uniref:stress protein n=1 Tax=Streptomyces sp. NPDC004539 TaxID=3154280 RepID=UPI0033BEF63A
MRILRKRTTALLLGAATLGSLLMPVSAVAAAASPARQGAGTAATQAQAAPQAGTALAAGPKIDVTSAVLDISDRIYDVITDAIERNQNRSGYVKSLREGAFYDAGQRYNVMVIKADHRYDSKFKRIVYDAKVKGGKYPKYRVVVFESGVVVNKGDGGYINWAFRGWFKRDGMKVTFRKR